LVNLAKTPLAYKFSAKRFEFYLCDANVYFNENKNNVDKHSGLLILSREFCRSFSILSHNISAVIKILFNFLKNYT
jgi:hypothetical protein